MQIVSTRSELIVRTIFVSMDQYQTVRLPEESNIKQHTAGYM
jgi:hypothetical protein